MTSERKAFRASGPPGRATGPAGGKVATTATTDRSHLVDDQSMTIEVDPHGEDEQVGISAAAARSRSIYAELGSYGLADIVAQTADRVYQEVDPRSRKADRRKEIHLYCVHQAYLRLDRLVPIEIVGAEMKMSMETIRGTSKSFNSRTVDRRFHQVVTFDVSYYIKYHLENNVDCGDDSKLRGDLTTRADQIRALLQKHALVIMQGDPNRLAVVILQCCFDHFEIAYTQAAMAALIKTSALTVRKLYSEVKKVLASLPEF